MAPGLRERKRLATKRSIQRAVLALVAEHGFENVTIEDVSREADIAPRTFFNYFPSKEAALVGDMPSDLSSVGLDVFVAGGPAGHFFEDFGEMVAQRLDGFTFDRELHQLRHSVFREHPALSYTHVSSMKDLEARIVEAVRQRLVNTGKPSDDALMLASIAFAAVRAAWMRWSRDEGTERSIADDIRSSCAHVFSLVSEYR